MNTEDRYALRLWTTFVLLPCLAVLAVAAVATACEGTHDVTPQHSPRVCFPVKRWGPAPDRYAPCVRVTRVSEDGSFRFAVSDHGGTVRYSGSVGNLSDGPGSEAPDETAAEEAAEAREVADDEAAECAEAVAEGYYPC